MIEYKHGDIFASEMQILVNPVNTVGIMGKGLALTFKNKYPEMFTEYKIQCDNGALDIGKLFVWEDG
jgi:O-acetyl-ADP-ribose deacetylase (regulator of RNase III)